MPTNALIHEKSPYLRQHAHNPVDWLPWGEQAFARARSEDKPIFLSIGYSTCHWCHVMAHESFENDQIAEVLNHDFVPIKLDREERPDVDRIYMLFVQASTGSGGWPMSVWLTPELKPFFGGTYFPPGSRFGRPGFLDLLKHLSNAWHNERERIETSGGNVLEQLRGFAETTRGAQQPDRDLFASAFWQFRRAFDTRWAGFGSAPKFPRPVVMNYLLRYHVAEKSSEALEMVTATLTAMARGGMHDQLGGGFHRYSVDDRWFVPHFEKMLYDQAQLAISCLEAHQLTKDPALAQIARGIFTYVLRDLRDPSGGFYSAEDADSPDPDHPGHSREGAFYVWKAAEISAILAEDDAKLFSLRFGVEPDGNVDQDPHGEFNGQNILFPALPLDEVAGRLRVPAEQATMSLAQSTEALFAVRSRRPRPHLDNKILTAWNALMISAFAKGFQVLGERDYLAAAERNASFLLSQMRDHASGALLRRFCDGEAAVSAFLDDYAFLIQALLDLFETTGTAGYLNEAVRLARENLHEFEDHEHGGFFSTRPNAPDLVLRIKDDYDGAEPSGNSVATDALLRLAHLTGDDQFRASAERSLRSFAPRLQAQPTMAPQMLVAVGRSLVEPEQVIIRCSERSEEVDNMVREYRARVSLYAAVFAITDEAALALKQTASFISSLERKGRMTIYECRNFVCELPKVID